MFDLHMHSVFSDGAHTPEEMAEEGLRRGLTVIGLSEHSFVETDDASMLPENGKEGRLLHHLPV